MVDNDNKIDNNLIFVVVLVIIVSIILLYKRSRHFIAFDNTESLSSGSNNREYSSNLFYKNYK